MEQILDWGLQAVLTLQQTLGLGAEPIFEGITFLGEQEFFLLLLPLLFWSVDFRLAARLGVLFLASAYLNTVVKDLLMQPRPGALDPSVVLSDSYGFGLPSGHAQTAVVVWGSLAAWLRRVWAWAAAGLLALLIGLSRVYLGVHFPSDVLIGWLIGVGVLWLYLAYGSRIESWLRDLGMRNQLLLGAGGTLLLLALHPVNDVVAAMAALAGLAVGLPLTLRRIGFSTVGPVWQRLLRFVLGAVVLVALFFGIRQIFPAEGQALYLPFRFVRYAVVGLWISLGAPWAFRRLGLASGSIAAA